ncbi:uncharacterized protein LOC135479501 isoform X2 [Liolophura sinensis]|uniref:uncharacterized protein LOC135479501 isoform X2 n=1 Tax=Liolophura sinensis TaxID=3198878 RepID=UPI00315893E6
MESNDFQSPETLHGSLEGINLEGREDNSSENKPVDPGRRRSLAGVEVSREIPTAGSTVEEDSVSSNTQDEDADMFSSRKSTSRKNSFGKACDLERDRKGTWNFSRNSKVAEGPKTPPPLPNRSPTTRLTFVDDLDSAYYSSSSSGGDSVVSSVLEEPPPDYEVTYEDLDAVRQDIYKRQQLPYPPPPRLTSHPLPPPNPQVMRITQVQGGGLTSKQPPASKANVVHMPGDTGHHYCSIGDVGGLPGSLHTEVSKTAVPSHQSAQPHVHVHLCQGECKSLGFQAGQVHFHPNTSYSRGLPAGGWQDNIPPPPSLYRGSVDIQAPGAPQVLPTYQGAYQEIPAQRVGGVPFPHHQSKSVRVHTMSDVMSEAGVQNLHSSSSVRAPSQKGPYHLGPQVVNIESIPDMPQFVGRAGSPLPPPPNFPAPPPPIVQNQSPSLQRSSLNQSPSPPLPPPPPELAAEYNNGLGIYEDIPGQKETPTEPAAPPAPPIPAPPPAPPIPTTTPHRKVSFTPTSESENPTEVNSNPSPRKTSSGQLSFSAEEIGNVLKTLKKTNNSKAKKSVPVPKPGTPEPVAAESVVLKSTPPSTSPASKTTPVTKAPEVTTTHKVPVPPPVQTEKRPLRSSSTSRVPNKFQNSTDEDKEPKIPATQTLRRTFSKVGPGGGSNINTSTPVTENLSPSRLKPIQSTNQDGKGPGNNALWSGNTTSKHLAHVNTAPELNSSTPLDTDQTEEHTVSPSAIAAKQGRGRSFVKGRGEPAITRNATMNKTNPGGITPQTVSSVNASPSGAQVHSLDTAENNKSVLVSSEKTTTTKPEEDDHMSQRKLSTGEILNAQMKFSQRDGKFQNSYTGTNHTAALTSRITSRLAKTTPQDENVSAPNSPPPAVMPKSGAKCPLPNSPLLSALYLTSVIKAKQSAPENTQPTATVTPSRAAAPPTVPTLNQAGEITLSTKNIQDFENVMASSKYKSDSKMEGIDVTKIPGYVKIPDNTPAWKRQVMEKKNAEILKKYQAQYEEILQQQRAEEERKRREEEERKLEEEKWKGIPEWKRKIMRDKKQQPPGGAAAGKQPAPQQKQAPAPQQKQAPAQKQAPPATAPKQKQAPPPQQQAPPPQPAQKKLDVKKAQPLPPEKAPQTPADIPLKVSRASITFKQNPAGTGEPDVPIKRSIKVLKRSKA